MDTVLIRGEQPKDQLSVFNVNLEAFERPAEAELVDSLRNTNHILLSLVAVLQGKIVGHALFTGVEVRPDRSAPVKGAALGPVAVLPEFQQLGIGTAMIQSGIRHFKSLGYPFLIVLGHPDYYSRFGFKKASQYNLNCQWQVPDDVFMALALKPDALYDLSGTVYYAPEFEGV